MKDIHGIMVRSLAVLALAGLLAGCSGSGGSAQDIKENVKQLESVIRSSPVQLSNIPIPIIIGEDGRVEKVAGFSASVVDSLAENLTGGPLLGRIVVLDKNYVAWLKRANIQHLTLASRPQGLFMLVNGRPLPYLSWDDTSIQDLLDTLGKFQKEKGAGAYALSPDAYETIATVLPLLKSLGARIDISFPKSESQQAIPIPGNEAFDVVVPEAEMSAQPQQTVDLTIDYRALKDDQGWVPTFFGFTTVELQQIGDQFNRKVPKLRLRQDIRKRLVAKGIHSMGIQSRADGLFVTVNGKVMPHLAWNEETLMNLSGLLTQLYPEGVKLPSDARWVPAIRATAPMYNNFAIAVLLRFPEK